MRKKQWERGRNWGEWTERGGTKVKRVFSFKKNIKISLILKNKKNIFFNKKIGVISALLRKPDKGRTRASTKTKTQE